MYTFPANLGLIIFGDNGETEMALNSNFKIQKPPNMNNILN